MKQVFILGGARTPMTTHVGALKDFSAIDLGAIASKAALDRTGTKPEWSANCFDDLEGDVRESIGRIRESPFIPNKDSIRGFVYDVHTGRLREVTPAA